MPETTETISTEAAEKAYAAAAADAIAKADAISPPAPLAFPAKPERDAAPKAEKTAAKPVKQAPAKAKAVAPKLAKPVKVAAAKPVKTVKIAAPKPAKPVKAAAPKPATIKPVPATNPVQFIKEAIMPAKKTTTDFTKTVKAAAAQAQAKAKAALAQGSVAFNEASEFTKGNVDAVVTSGKILGAGLQDLGKTYVAESKTALDKVTGDVKQLVAVQSPVEFVQVQSAILRSNFDHAITFNAKTSETVLKLVGDAFAPLSARANLVVEKVKKAA